MHYESRHSKANLIIGSIWRKIENGSTCEKQHGVVLRESVLPITKKNYIRNNNFYEEKTLFCVGCLSILKQLNFYLRMIENSKTTFMRVKHKKYIFLFSVGSIFSLYLICVRVAIGSQGRYCKFVMFIEIILFIIKVFLS